MASEEPSLFGFGAMRSGFRRWLDDRALVSASSVLHRTRARLLSLVKGTEPFIRGLDRHCLRQIGRALVSYKTESIFDPSLARWHRAFWEVLDMIEALNEFGLVVDVIHWNAAIERLDRLRDEYELFIGLGVGNTGKNFVPICTRLPRAVKALYALGPDPEHANALIEKRYAYFSRRHGGKQLKRMRTSTQIDFAELRRQCDVVFAIGNETSLASFRGWARPVYRLFPASIDELSADLNQLRTRSPTSFLYFGGPGNLIKGLDLALEAFAGLPDLELHVCAPLDEADFWDHYRDLLAVSPNISIHGPLYVGGEAFRALTARCGFVVLPSSKEGTTTAGTAAMRRGLVPIATPAAGLDLGSFGLPIEEIAVDALRVLLKQAAGMSTDELFRRSSASYQDSFKYTKHGYATTIRQAIAGGLALRR